MGFFAENLVKKCSVGSLAHSQHASQDFHREHIWNVFPCSTQHTEKIWHHFQEGGSIECLTVVLSF